MKDFEYLKFLNDTILKDEVLDKFMQKAEEIEMAAGPQALAKNAKRKELTPLEKVQSIQSEFKINPVSFHTCTNLDSLLKGPEKQRR